MRILSWSYYVISKNKAIFGGRALKREYIDSKLPLKYWKKLLLPQHTIWVAMRQEESESEVEEYLLMTVPRLMRSQVL